MDHLYHHDPSDQPQRENRLARATNQPDLIKPENIQLAIDAQGTVLLG